MQYAEGQSTFCRCIYEPYVLYDAKEDFYFPLDIPSHRNAYESSGGARGYGSPVSHDGTDFSTGTLCHPVENLIGRQASPSYPGAQTFIAAPLDPNTDSFESITASPSNSGAQTFIAAPLEVSASPDLPTPTHEQRPEWFQILHADYQEMSLFYEENGVEASDLAEAALFCYK